VRITFVATAVAAVVFACGASQGLSAAEAPKTATHSGRLDPNDPGDAVRIDQKLNCSLTEGDVVVYWWKGTAYSRVPGEQDMPLFNVEGMNIRQCKNFADEKRGHGFRSVSREILLYRDLKTNEVLRTWKNPWTGEDVEVIHVANDPVNMRAPMYAYTADGKPHRADIRIAGKRVWSSGEAPLFYKNPLAGDYQDMVGNEYHAMEALNAYAYADDLLDATKPKLERYTLSWARFSDWLPWMKMHGRTGMMIFTTVGGRVASFNDLPDSIRKEIEAKYPAYNRPPPLDDARPNETSWTYIKKIVDSKRSSGAKAGE